MPVDHVILSDHDDDKRSAPAGANQRHSPRAARNDRVAARGGTNGFVCVRTFRAVGRRLVQLKHVATVARPLQLYARAARVFVFLVDGAAVQAHAARMAVLAGVAVGKRVGNF